MASSAQILVVRSDEYVLLNSSRGRARWSSAEAGARRKERTAAAAAACPPRRRRRRRRRACARAPRTTTRTPVVHLAARMRGNTTSLAAAQRDPLALAVGPALF
ncbi:hypothetical protein O0L34_g3087 [Tuta absoluta]|nr:hypothetical protein O0L34_g3087 [Tuta absoluta]